MRIVFFLRLIFASCPWVEKSLPGRNHIRQTVSAESACGGIRIFLFTYPLTLVLG